MHDHITNWIERISGPQKNLGGLAVCPFAKKSKYTIVETDGSDITPCLKNLELIIYKFPDHYSKEQIYEIAAESNSLYPELIFLPDYRERHTQISGVPTNNGRYNLILCQMRVDLEKARKKLANTDYYSFWDKDYLKEIVGDKN
jgi:hypothetical protein